MLRRFVLVGLMVLAQGSMLQLVIGTLLSATFLLFQVQASPYKNMSDDFLASGSSFALVAIFLCSYAFKYSAFFGLDDIKQRMSEEQRDLYVVNQGTLTLIMIASTLGSIVLSFVLFIIQLSIEAARMRREQRASKARRLRYKSNNQEVLVMDLDDQHYHTFLSHVWGTGQDQMVSASFELHYQLKQSLMCAPAHDSTPGDLLCGFNSHGLSALSSNVCLR